MKKTHVVIVPVSAAIVSLGKHDEIRASRKHCPDLVLSSSQIKHLEKK